MSDSDFAYESDGGSYEGSPAHKKNKGAARGVSDQSYGSMGYGGSSMSGEGFAYEEEDMRLDSDPNTKNLYTRGRPWEVLTPYDIKKRQAAVTEETVELIGVEADVAQFLLRSYRWNGNELSEDWFADSSAVLKRLGLPNYIGEGGPDSEMAKTPQEGKFFDPLMADEVPYSETAALPCGHRFSDGCWEGYLKCAVGDGAETALNKRCPMNKCGDIVRLSLWERYLKKPKDDRDWTRFEDFLMRSYVEMGDPHRIRWCPSPGCTNAVELHCGATDVACSCGYRFCMSCGDEAHVPVPCDILRKWNEKNQSEADNVTWILVNTKNCPKCKHPIEKNMGCMHMTCRCRYEFCWICLGDWKNHTNCNEFQMKQQTDPTLAAEEAKRIKAKEMLDRYTHHFERYQAHNHGQKIAQDKTLKESETKSSTLREILGDLHDFEFLLMAVRQIIECRRMLKWSYAFLYFAKLDPEKKAFFVFQQGQLEKYLDVLQETAEKTKLDELVGEGSTSYQPFFDYKSKLTNQTRVVQDFFSKMGEAFANEFAFFEEEESKPAAGGASSSGGGASAAKAGASSSGGGASSSGSAAKAAPKAKAQAKAKVSTTRR